MPTITINGREIEYEKGKMILQVALDNGIEIPHYCYHDGLSIVANCRICLDFKTDRIDREIAVSEAERYRDQLDSYRLPAARRIGIEVEAVSGVVLFVSADVAVELR